LIYKILKEVFNLDNTNKSESEIRARYQITIPDEIRTKAKLSIGDSLIWMYDDIRQEIIVMPKPKSFSDKLWGLGKEVWDKENVEDTIKEERAEW
jgi:bifunctional DNA-binding transcriptional regulator/antitoxin component of YhaV-PrlF toxin-antitoxin module